MYVMYICTYVCKEGLSVCMCVCNVCMFVMCIWARCDVMKCNAMWCMQMRLDACMCEMHQSINSCGHVIAFMCLLHVCKQCHLFIEFHVTWCNALLFCNMMHCVLACLHVCMFVCSFVGSSLVRSARAHVCVQCVCNVM